MSTNILSPEYQFRFENLLQRADGADRGLNTSKEKDGIYIRTPFALCIEIVAELQKLHGDLSGKKILVVDTIEFIPVLLAFKVNPCNITYVAPYKFKREIARKLEISEDKAIRKSLLDCNDEDFKDENNKNMKFDVVIGNPPYQDGKNNNFYQEFVKKSFDLSNDVVSMITPSNWISFADSGSEFLRILKANGLFLYKFLGSKGFDDVQLITVYLITSKLSFNGNVRLITCTGETTLPQSSVIYFPTKTTQALEIISRIAGADYDGMIGIKGGLDRNKAIASSNNGIKCIFSVGRKNGDFDWAFVDNSHLLKNGIVGLGVHKVVVSRITSLGKLGETKYADPTFACAQACYYFQVTDASTAKNLITYLESKIVKLIVAELKGAVCSNSQNVFEFIPRIDFTRSWTDVELYKHFSLIQEEIDYIEATIK